MAQPMFDVVCPCCDAILKIDPETRHIPIIVLSAHAMPNDRHQALAAGGDDLDTKPVQFDRLLAKIEALLAAHSGRTTALPV